MSRLARLVAAPLRTSSMESVATVCSLRMTTLRSLERTSSTSTASRGSSLILSSSSSGSMFLTQGSISYTKYC